MEKDEKQIKKKIKYNHQVLFVLFFFAIFIILRSHFDDFRKARP
jgi:hypothetical protein